MISKENFAGSCIDICNNISSTTDVNTIQACDTGSQLYCTDIAFIGSDNCTSYINRLADTQNNPNLTGLIKVQTPSTTSIQNYYNAVVSQSDMFCSTEKIINGDKFCKLGDGIYQTKLFLNKSTADKEIQYKRYVDYCSNNLSNSAVALFYREENSATTPMTGIFSINGFKSWRDTQISTANNKYAFNANLTVDTVIDFYTDTEYIRLYRLYPARFIAIDNKLKSYLSDSILTNVNIFKAMNASAIATNNIYTHIASELNIRADLNVLIDRLVVFITNAENTTTGLTTTGRQDARFTTLKALISSSLTFIQSTGICNTTNPFDSKCNDIYNNTSMTYNGINILNNAKLYIDNKRLDHCSDSSKITSNNFANCSKQITNTSIVSDKDKIRRTLTNYCATTIDTPNCTPYPKINSSDSDTIKWLTDNTKNTIDNATKTITSVCGTSNNFSVQDCTNICSKYPLICNNDILQKCSLPSYRYNNTSNGGTNTFTNKELLTNYSNDSITIIISLIVIIFIGMIIIHIIKKYNSYDNNFSGNALDNIYQTINFKV